MTHGRQADDPRACAIRHFSFAICHFSCAICHFSCAMPDLDPIDDGLAWSLRRRRERPILFPPLQPPILFPPLQRGGQGGWAGWNRKSKIRKMFFIDLLPVVLSFAGTLVLTPVV